MTNAVSKADLHIHSRFSDRPAEWLLRRLDFPDSCSDPRELYDELKRRGMDFVTITDHNRIEGCLEIADRPGAFISEQVTTFFPEDHCQVHLLVWGITEEQHREIQPLRGNICELQKYLAQHDIAHAVAHPLYKLDDKLGVAHLEKLALLFKCFEGVNGLRDALLSEIAQFVLGKLTREKIDEFANRHNLAPTHDEPWRKILVAGSDDHGGMFPASAFTETERAETPAEFLRHLRAGRCAPRGAGGTPLALSHGLYNTIYAFIGDKFLKGNKLSGGLLEKVFSRFMEGRDPTQFTVGEKIGFVVQAIGSGKIFELAKPANASLWTEFAKYFAETDFSALVAKETKGIAEPERRAFVMANLLANQLAFRFFTKFVTQVSSGNLIESIQDLSTLVPVLLMLSPYIYSFQSQAPSRKWLREICRGIAGETPPELCNTKRAWFTDTLEDVNGVANTIRKMTAAAVNAGRDLTVVTSRTQIQITDIPIKNFAPIGEFELPEYELQKLSFPPILQMIDYIQREKFTELIISTPGPVGITALIAAKMLGLQTSGIYHTDFPQYVRILTDDSFFETLTWNYMSWFYSQLDLLYVNSEHYRQCWIQRGIAPGKIKILPRGLDTSLFHPSRHEPDFWKKFGMRNGAVTLLYVGRISKEKDLDVLAAAFRKLRASKLPVDLVLVGDGPYLKELRETLPEAHFTGYLAGIDLAKAFASADVFVFPSTTDTFGNVVLEALASGLPAVVSDQGGPRELVAEGVTGHITKSLDADHFAEAIRRVATDAASRRTMSANARRAVESRDWADASRRFWAASGG
jgi:glycosyltransferase involved in cell wall biosynthesis